MTLRLHDTMSRGPKEVVPLEPDHVRLYTCGPTVYARAHIGNFRTFVFEDILRRWLERRFGKVTHVMNLTDVEDKIIRNASASGHGLEQETAPWIAAFFEDVDALNIRRAHHYPKATEYIDQMVAMVQTLEHNGLTYTSDGSVYFHIAAFPNYGRLSGVQTSELQTGASGRIDADEYDKEEARDFALWKAVGPEEIGWETPLGRGRPGWHIECSAMSTSLLGDSFDIHCGGVDNMFPHHENEIAQSEGATGKPFVQIWCHAAHLRIGGDKMAKSAGNFSTLHDVLTTQRVRPSAVRYLLAAAAKYGKPLNYTPESLADAADQVDRYAGFRDRVFRLKSSQGGSDRLRQEMDAAEGRFEAAMDDDLNLSGAMGEVFAFIRLANRELDETPPSEKMQEQLLAFIDRVDDVLGVLPLVDAERAGRLDGELQALLDRRVQARASRDFATSDQIRDELALHGVLVEDTAAGQRWRRE